MGNHDSFRIHSFVMLSEKVALSDWFNFLFHTLSSRFYEEKDSQSAASFGDIRQLREVAK